MRNLAVILAAAVSAILVSTTSPAAAKSKAQVAAGACMSQHAAGAVYGRGGLKYRIINGRRCWYHPGKAVAKAKPAPKRIRVASLSPKVPAVKAAPAVAVPALEPDDNLEHVKRILCGGPCPRFDLDNGPDRATYRALCGGPCPDFRARFDDAFAAFGLSP
jgi:hypothetical protein